LMNHKRECWSLWFNQP